MAGIRSAVGRLKLGKEVEPSVYPPHFYYRKRKHTFLITSLCLKSFPSFCRMGVLFAQNKRIFSHTSYPERAFSAPPYHLSTQLFPPDIGIKPWPHAPGYGPRGERRFSGVWRPPVAGCWVNFQPNLQYILNRTNQTCETNSSPAK